MITFDDFTPGKLMGTASVTLDEALVQQWLALFPDDAPLLPGMPEGMTAVLVMRAYMTVLSPRPPGNVHASQEFEMHGVPHVGERVITTIRCQDKVERKGRKWVHLLTDSRDASGALLFTGRKALIWAA